MNIIKGFDIGEWEKGVKMKEEIRFFFEWFFGILKCFFFWVYLKCLVFVYNEWFL